MIPSSSYPLGFGMQSESISSISGACVRTEALYLEMDGQYRDPTTCGNFFAKNRKYSFTTVIFFFKVGIDYQLH